MEERRLLLAVALSLLVLTAYQLLFPPPPPPRVAPSPVPTAAVAETAPGGASSPGVASSPVPAPSAAPAAAVADDRERRVELELPGHALAFTNRGARLVSWQLLDFKDPRGRPEEMVQTIPGAPRPLDVETGDEAVDARLREGLFRPSAERVAVAGAAAELVFDYAEGDLEARKAFAFDPRGGLLSIRAAVRRAGAPVPVRLLWGPGLGTPTAEEMGVQGYHPPQAVYYDDEVERVPAKDIGAPRMTAPVRWVGVESTYFAALLVPPAGPAPTGLRAVAVPGADETSGMAPVVSVTLRGPEDAALLYVGPKDHARLARVGHRLVDVVPVGTWIGPIVVPLIGLLKWAYGLVGNYGWAIVVLTVLINVAMAPFRHYSIANGVKMAKLSPEMRVIQERYRKFPALDPRRQEMQKEIAALYARHGMSMGTQMAVGCLPILITMPFLIAFYRVLTVAIELKGAPFLWIPDLSQKDPLFITPVLMAASMFVMQKLTPTAMDPAQQKMMMIMPLVFGVMFFAAPGGLNLYWLVSNLCAIVQQGLTLRMLAAQDARAGRRPRK